jgi:D-sedoheptulose 7-phosphate isomerase
MTDDLVALFRDVADTMARAADSSYIAAITRATDLLTETFQSGRKLLVFGNGGSSADAQHLTAELVGRFAIDRSPLPAIALTTNQAILTAWSNDCDFADVFARQIEALGVPGDVALAISTSGKSPNIIEGLRRARDRGLKTIGLTGESGGDIASLCDVLLAAPATSTARIQELHLVTYHAICGAIERRLFTQG